MPDSPDNDAMVAAPGHHSVLLENAKVRVLDTRLGPGETTPVHAHRWPAALYVLSWSDFVRKDAHGAIILDSRQARMHASPGEAFWGSPLDAHSVTNVGSSLLHIIAVEIKPGTDDTAA